MLSHDNSTAPTQRVATWPPNTFPAYLEMCAFLPRVERDLPKPGRCATVRLSAWERATAQVTVAEHLYLEHSVLGEAAWRLSHWADQGWLRFASAHAVARRLQYSMLSPGHPATWFFARRGWSLLAAMDRTGAAVIWLDAEPADGHGPRRHMRLHERIAELERHMT